MLCLMITHLPFSPVIDFCFHNKLGKMKKIITVEIFAAQTQLHCGIIFLNFIFKIDIAARCYTDE